MHRHDIHILLYARFVCEDRNFRLLRVYCSLFIVNKVNLFMLNKFLGEISERILTRAYKCASDMLSLRFTVEILDEFLLLL